MSKKYHLGISGGKDSTALLLWAVHESGIPHSEISATFSDTDNEHEWTYWFVRFLSRTVFPITWLTPELGFYDLAKKKKRFPSMVARFCTEQLKMVPTEKHLQKLVEEGHEVIALSGIRNDESYERSNRREFEPACGGAFGVPVWNPLIKWKIEDVWAIHARYNIPRNPLYVPTQTCRGTYLRNNLLWHDTPLGARPFRTGAARVGCFPCVNSRKDEIANIARNFPDRINAIREEELLVSAASDYRFTSFFHPKVCPPRYHSVPVDLKSRPVRAVKVTRTGGRGRKKKKTEQEVFFEGELIDHPATEGKQVMCPSVDDIVRWAVDEVEDSGTLDPEIAELEMLGRRLCSSKYGACE